jgi:hypothetical protein
MFLQHSRYFEPRLLKQIWFLIIRATLYDDLSIVLSHKVSSKGNEAYKVKMKVIEIPSSNHCRRNQKFSTACRVIEQHAQQR